MTDKPDDAMTTFEWIPPSAGIPEPTPAEPLRDLLAPLSEDRGRSAADLTQRIARETAAWLFGDSSPDEGIHAALAAELVDIRDAHGWRGTVARFLDALGPSDPAQGPTADNKSAAREALAQVAADFETGDRFGDKTRCAAPLLEGPLGVMEGETILVHGWSETVARAFELTQARGLRPEAIVSEGGPDLGGRRLARRLVASGVPVRFIYDAAIHEAVTSADRIWIGTETVCARSFVARVGTRSLLHRAHDLDVEAAVITTTEKFMEGAELTLPTWAASEAWHLWEGAPRDVVIESQSFEAVPVELVRAFATDKGLVGPAQISSVNEAARSLATA